MNNLIITWTIFTRKLAIISLFFRDAFESMHLHSKKIGLDWWQIGLQMENLLEILAYKHKQWMLVSFMSATYKIVNTIINSKPIVTNRKGARSDGHCGSYQAITLLHLEWIIFNSFNGQSVRAQYIRSLFACLFLFL